MPYDAKDAISEHNRRISRVNCIAWMRQGLKSGLSFSQRIRNRFGRA